MKEVTTGKGTFIFVETKANLRIEGNKIVWGAKRFGKFSKSLPSGSWSLLGWDNEVAEEIVESGWWYDGPQEQHGLGKVTYYREYPNELSESALLFATESLSTLKEANGLDTSKRYYVLKKN